VIVTKGHIGISLPDIVKGVKWYLDVFNLYQISDIMEASVENEGIFCEIEKNIFGKKHKKFKVVHLSTNDGFGIELFEHVEPKNIKPENNFEYWKSGLSHIAFTVKNIEKMCSKIINSGGKQRSKIWKPWKNKSYKICYCEDPWGTVLELNSHPYIAIWSNYSNSHEIEDNY